MTAKVKTFHQSFSFFSFCLFSLFRCLVYLYFVLFSLLPLFSLLFHISTSSTCLSHFPWLLVILSTSSLLTVFLVFHYIFLSKTSCPLLSRKVKRCECLSLLSFPKCLSMQPRPGRRTLMMYCTWL